MDRNVVTSRLDRTEWEDKKLDFIQQNVPETLTVVQRGKEFPPNLASETGSPLPLTLIYFLLAHTNIPIYKVPYYFVRVFQIVSSVRFLRKTVYAFLNVPCALQLNFFSILIDFDYPNNTGWKVRWIRFISIQFYLFSWSLCSLRSKFVMELYFQWILLAVLSLYLLTKLRMQNSSET